jgi:hypothetical protein
MHNNLEKNALVGFEPMPLPGIFAFFGHLYVFTVSDVGSILK